jgi:outer membrane immunogenic protein
MKKVNIAVSMLALSAFGASAADLPLRYTKAPVAPVVTYNWSGFYAGVNLGYGFGTNRPTTGNLTQVGSETYIDTGIGTTFAFPITGGGSGNLFGDRPIQSGFLGGAQIGYNYQFNRAWIVGIEADIQGSGIRGSGTRGGFASANSQTFLDADSFVQTEQFIQSGAVQQQIQAGVDWFGTVRGRLGYLITPTFLGFVTGGLTYGEARANIGLTSTQLATLTGESFIGFNPTTTQTFAGGGSASRLLVGWNAGAGFEWMVGRGWSVKTEALYWNLGNLDVNTAASGGTASFPLGIEAASESAVLNPALLSGRQTVNFQGVIVRAGLNYHFGM